MLEETIFNRLHHVCQLWVAYLRGETEKEKERLLYEAASHLALYFPQGAEGEEVLQQVWGAIRKRGRVYASPRYWYEAADNGALVYKGVPREYPFTYSCACGGRETLRFPDINHAGDFVACKRCSACTPLTLDVAAMDADDAQLEQSYSLRKPPIEGQT